MTAFSAFYPFIRPDMPGCPDIAVDSELLKVANEFCEKTWVYQVDVTESVVSGDTSIEPTLPTSTQLVGVISAESGDESQFYDFTIDGDSIVLDYDATGDEDYTIVISVKPTLSATTIPDVLFRDHADTVISGVKAGLFMSPQKSWTNPDLSMFYRKKYEDGMDVAAGRVFLHGSPTEKRILSRGYL